MLPRSSLGLRLAARPALELGGDGLDVGGDGAEEQTPGARAAGGGYAAGRAGDRRWLRRRKGAAEVSGNSAARDASGVGPVSVLAHTLMSYIGGRAHRQPATLAGQHALVRLSVSREVRAIVEAVLVAGGWAVSR